MSHQPCAASCQQQVIACRNAQILEMARIGGSLEGRQQMVRDVRVQLRLVVEPTGRRNVRLLAARLEVRIGHQEDDRLRC